VYNATPNDPTLFSPTLTYNVDVSPGNPPHVALTGPFWGGTFTARPGHARGEIIGYHKRRVLYFGHRPWRMNGFERKCWGAAKVAYTEGYFPDWDPLERHPTLDDLDHGADGYSGPFPQTPRA